MIRPNAILMCEPTYFDVIDIKNAFMVGSVGTVDRDVALSQWRSLKALIESLGTPVAVLPASSGLEDMVFCANPSFVGLSDQNEKIAVLSQMRFESRKKETPFHQAFFQGLGYEIKTLPPLNQGYEGRGDTFWHPMQRHLWCGVGPRSGSDAYRNLAKLFNATFNMIPLVHPRFYHLDTCFCPLTEDAVMLFPEALASEILPLIRRAFHHVIEVSSEEANRFACNSISLGSGDILSPTDSLNTKTRIKLQDLGLKLHESDTSEFQKSGGSIACLTLAFWMGP